jgi:hypothetical protein
MKRSLGRDGPLIKGLVCDSYKSERNKSKTSAPRCAEKNPLVGGYRAVRRSIIAGMVLGDSKYNN